MQAHIYLKWEHQYVSYISITGNFVILLRWILIYLSISNQLCFCLSFAWILISLQETNELVAIKKFKDSEGECRANEGRKRVEEEDS